MRAAPGNKLSKCMNPEFTSYTLHTVCVNLKTKYDDIYVINLNVELRHVDLLSKLINNLARY